MTNQTKDKIILFALLDRYYAKKGIKDHSVKTLETIAELRNNIDFELYQKDYAKACRQYRKALNE